MEGKAALVSATVRDDGAAALKPIFSGIEAELDRIATRHAGFEMRLTGVTYVSAAISLSMISELAFSLFAAGVIIDRSPHLRPRLHAANRRCRAKVPVEKEHRHDHILGR